MIVQAISQTLGGGKNQSELEDFLLKTNNSSVPFFQAFFDLVNSTDISESIKIAIFVVLKKHVQTNWLELGPEVKSVFSQRLFVVCTETANPKQRSLACDCLYLVLLKKEGNLVQEIEDHLLQVLQAALVTDTKTLNVIYLFSKIYKIKEYEPDHKSKPESRALIGLFEVLLQIVKREESNEANAKEVLHLCAKIFFKVNRYYMLKEVGDEWFEVFGRILRNFKKLEKASKWVSRLMMNIFRSKSNGKDKKGKSKEELVKDVFGFQYVETLMEILYTFDPLTDSSKLIYNISRSYFHLIRESRYRDKYQEAIWKLIHERLFLLLVYPDETIVAFEDNPIELFLTTDEFYHDSNVRESALSIIVSTCKEMPVIFGSLLNFIYQLIIDASKSDLVKEAGFYLIEKLVGEIHKQWSAASIEGMVANLVLPCLSASNYIVRVRGCCLLKAVLSEEKEEKLLNIDCVAIAQKLCFLVQDPVFSVRGVAALTLLVMLKNSKVVEMIKPHLSSLVTIYLKLIDECGHENLINSLTELFEIFEAELSPFVVDLFSSLCNLIVKINRESQIQQKNNSNSDEVERTTFSMLSAFGTIGQVLKSSCRVESLNAMTEAFSRAVIELLPSIDFETLEELLTLTNLFLSKFSPSTVPSSLWMFFEFICNYKLKRELLSTPSINSLLHFLPETNEYDDCTASVIQLLRQFLHKGKEVVLTRNDEFGRGYLSLMMRVINEEIDKSLGTDEEYYLEEQAKVSGHLFIGSLGYELRQMPATLQQISYFGYNIQKTLHFVSQSKYSEISKNVFLFNTGAAFFLDVKQTFEEFRKLGLLKGFVSNWVQNHKKSLTASVRKSSLLGLVSLLSSKDLVRDCLKEEGLDFTSLLLFCLEECVFIELQSEIEEEQEDEDMDILNDTEDEDEEDDQEPEPAPVFKIFGETLDEFSRKVKGFSSDLMGEVETLISYDTEYVTDEFGTISYVALFKGLLVSLSTECSSNIYDSLLASVSSEMKEKVISLFKD